MLQFTGLTFFICTFLLILTACGDLSDQIRQPLGYGEMPPGEIWVAIDRAYQSPLREIVYYDPKTIRRDGDRVTLWQLRDYKTMQGNAPFGMFMMSPHRFFSTTSHKEFDCRRNTVRILASSEHSQHMGTGTASAMLVEQSHGQPVEPGTVNQALRDVACVVTTSSN